MALYSYKAVKLDGEVQEGVLEAASLDELNRKLQSAGLIPMRTRVAGGLSTYLERRKKKGFGLKDVALVTRELATLLEAGLTLDRSLQILIDLADDEGKARLLGTLQEAVRGGAVFSDALERHPEVFSKLYVNMVRAGEVSGALDAVLSRLADYLEQSQALRETVKSALVYPSILVAVAALSLVVLLMFVVPQFKQLFADLGAALPLPTQIVIGIGDLFREYWWLLVAFAALLAALVARVMQNPRLRYRWDVRVLRAPLFGDLLWKLETARFSHTLATLLKSGLPLLSALTLSKEVVGNRRIAELLGETAEELKHGKGLAGPMLARGVLPKMALQMIKVGEESGSLDAMLGKVAGVYDQESRATVQRLLTLLEPLLIIGLGVIIAGIIMSILLAILAANDLVL
jgi:general secretion pathway protein F